MDKALFGRMMIGVCAASSFGTFACTDETVQTKGAENNSSPKIALENSEYGIKVLLGDSEQLTTIAAQSVTSPTGLEPFPELGENELAQLPGLHEQADIGVGVDGETIIDLDEYADSSGSPRNTSLGAHLLTWAAAVQCRQEMVEKVPTYDDFAQIVERPWNNYYQGPAWWHFNAKADMSGGEDIHHFESCDDILAHQQLTLCVAGKLSDVADAVAPLVWEAPGLLVAKDAAGPGDAIRYGDLRIYHDTWTIPPQSTRDKFLARDLAINALAHVAALDYEWPDPSDYPVPVEADSGCYELYDSIVADADAGSLDSDTVDFVFGTSGTTKYPPIDTIAPGTVRGLVKARLEEKTQVLRASGLLLKELLDKSVEADIAGAAVQRSRAADPKLGNERAWGLEGGSPTASPDNLYNNLAHATNLLFGRLEVYEPVLSTSFSWLGPIPPTFHETLDAPVYQCERAPRSGVARTLLNGFSTPYFYPLDGGLNGRWNSRPVTTPGQAYAVNLLESAGILLPFDNADGHSMTEYKTAIVEQLLVDAAVERGLGDADDDDPLTGEPFRDTQAAEAIRASVVEIADADLRFAMDRSAEVYSYLTQFPFGTTPDLHYWDNFEDYPGGLTYSSNETTAITDLGGIVLEGPVPTADLYTDLMSLAAHAEKNSQCRLHSALPVGAVNSLEGRNRVFQSTFALGDSLRSRLGLVADVAETQNLGSSVSEEARVAASGLRTWAGSGRIFNLSSIQSNGTREIWLHLQGFHPKDFGVSTIEDFASELVLVYGAPWAADCAAGIRQSCPDDFESDYVRVPQWSVPFGTPDPTTEGSYFTLYLHEEGFGPAFDPQFTDSWNSGKNLYLVSRISKEDPTRGQVLAAFRLLLDPDDQTMEVVSDYRRDLFNKIAGLNESRNEVGGQPAGTPTEDCTGLPHDYFVPLENELTSDSDSFENSWKHYLSLAELAAARADELGQELVAKGLERDFRREAAGEEIGQICGELGALDDFEYDSVEASIKAPDDNQALQTCLGESTTDVVFLTTDPFKGAGGDHTGTLQDWLGCQSGDDSGFCKPGIMLHDRALGLAEYVEPGARSLNTECVAPALRLAQSVANGNDISPGSARELTAYSPMRTANMAATLGAIAVNVTSSLEWSVSLGGVPIMRTETAPAGEANLFPACVSAGDCDDLGTNLAALFGVTVSPQNAAERDVWLQRITRALWLTASWTGRMPGSVINMPIVAADVDEIRNVGGAWPPAVALFGSGSFEDTFDANGVRTWTFNAQGAAASGLDVEIMGSGYDVLPDYKSAITAGTAREPWQASLYTNNIIHFWASNSPVSIDGKELDDFLANFTSTYRSTGCADSAAPDIDTSFPVCTGPTGLVHLYGPDAGVPCDQATFADTNRSQELSSIPIPGNWGKGAMCPITGPFDPACAPVYDETFGYTLIDPDCTTDLVGNDGVRFTETAFLPSNCSPGDRVGAYSGAFRKSMGCERHERVVDAMGLMCILGSGMNGIPPSQPLPAIADVADLVRLKQWLFEQGYNARKALSLLMLRSVPDRVVNDFLGGTVGSGTIDGAVGDRVLQLGDDIRRIASGWVSLSGDFELLAHAIDDTQLALTGIDIANDIELKQLAMQRLEQEARVSKAIVSAAASTFSLAAGIATAGTAGAVGYGNPFSNLAEATNSAIDIGVALQQLDNLKDLEGLADKGKANDVARALSALQGTTIPLYTNMQNTISEIRTATSSALSSASQLSLLRKQAEYVAAKGTGAPFYKTPDGETIELPVNVVLNNQYNLTKQRYERALEQAKRLAFLARLAIEQRIGQRLSTIDTPVGVLDPPSSWESDVCEFQGIDYDNLRTFGALDFSDTENFASPFIGDYVESLRNFMEYYNIEYPSHESDDLAIISVRDDLLGSGGRCYGRGTNLLRYSGALGAALGTAFEDEDTNALPTEAVGWEMNRCVSEDATCLAVDPGETLLVDANGTLLSPPSEVGYGGISWLHHVPFVGAPDAVETAAGPSGTVSQAVELMSGTSYILSWWDMARMLTDAEAAAYTSGFDPAAVNVESDYEVAVYDDDWNIIAAQTIQPHNVVVDGALTWSERRVFQFSPAESGIHHVTFSASVPGDVGSVAIANVQLEEAIGTNEPTSYSHTEESLLRLTGNCTEGNPEEFRSQFAYQCDETGDTCWWELKPNLVINTEDINAGKSSLEGKVARGNFNYRHVTTALNIVGTGVRECGSVGTQDCYGSGVLEYTLEHAAFDVPIVDYVGEKAQAFDFGVARIERGKALATERYLTVPLGSADEGLVSQPQTTKHEFRGRPLSGAYRLRIFDSPELAWDRVDDVQLVLNYRYWSRIRREAEE